MPSWLLFCLRHVEQALLFECVEQPWLRHLFGCKCWPSLGFVMLSCSGCVMLGSLPDVEHWQKRHQKRVQVFRAKKWNPFSIGWLANCWPSLGFVMLSCSGCVMLGSLPDVEHWQKRHQKRVRWPSLGFVMLSCSGCVMLGSLLDVEHLQKRHQKRVQVFRAKKWNFFSIGWLANLIDC